MSAAPAPVLATYVGRNLHGQVVNELGRRIVSGTYPVGGLLPNEELLGAELAVSRTALRESIKVLAAKGLLESRPRVGTRIRDRSLWNVLDPDVLAWQCAVGANAEFLRHLAEMREIIEPAAASLASVRRSETQLSVIRDALQQMERAADVDEWVRADVAFHTAILQATNNPLLMPLAALINSALGSLLLGVTARGAGNFKRALPEHEKVFAAIEEGDAQAALHRMAGMLTDTRALIKRSASGSGT